MNEFCFNTHYNRKYAIRLLNGPPPGKLRPRARRQRRATYGHQVLSVLAAVWKAAGYPWSVRLKALLPLWMPWVRKHFRMSKSVEQQLIRISSPRQIDRRLRAQKLQIKRRIYGRTKPGTLLKHYIPLKTDNWDVKLPGFAEVDLVAHCGNSSDGEFAHSLNVTDIHTTWTESRALLGRSRAAVIEAFDQIEAALPFRLLGLDSDNGSEFMNWHLRAWCAKRDIQFTRGRPTLQERRQCLRRAEELDPCAEAPGVGPLRWRHQDRGRSWRSRSSPRVSGYPGRYGCWPWRCSLRWPCLGVTVRGWVWDRPCSACFCGRRAQAEGPLIRDAMLAVTEALHQGLIISRSPEPRAV